MTVGELFAGIGGIGLGLERAGMTVKWAIENEPYAARVLRKNFSHVDVIEQDTTTVDFNDLSKVDLLTGGFPCQDISYAGKGEGIEGQRSSLWSEFHRAITQLEPSWVLVENVPALTSRGLGVLLRDLAQSRFDAVWTHIPAAAIGAPHRRDRIFIVAYSQSIRGRQAKPIQAGRNAIGKSSKTILGYWWATESSVGRLANGIPSRMDRFRCLGNAVVPQVAEFIGHHILAADEAMRS